MAKKWGGLDSSLRWNDNIEKTKIALNWDHFAGNDISRWMIGHRGISCICYWAAGWEKIKKKRAEGNRSPKIQFLYKYYAYTVF
jgi:hypothetical protein